MRKSLRPSSSRLPKNSHLPSVDCIHALGGWEGDRVVRGVAGVRWQSGYKAVAIDAQTFKDSTNDEGNWIDQEHDTEPTS